MMIRTDRHKRFPLPRALAASFIALALAGNALAPRTARAVELPANVTADGPSAACLDRKGMTPDEVYRATMFYQYFSHLDRVRPRTPTDDDSAYREALGRILVQTRPGTPKSEIVLDSPRLVEKGLEMVVFDELRNLISRSVGLDSSEARAFVGAFQPILLEDSGWVSAQISGPLRAAAKALAKAVDGFYAPRLRAAARNLDSLRASWRGDLAAIDALMARYAVLEQQRKQTLTAIERVTRIGEQLARRTSARADDKLFAYQKALQGVTGVGVLVGSVWVVGPATAMATSAAGIAGTLGAGCVIGAFGGGAAAALEDATAAFGRAYLRSEALGTSLGCEMREQAAANGGDSASLDGLARGLVSGMANGCTVVGATMVAPKAVGVAISAAAAGAAGLQAYEAAKLTRKALRARRRALQLGAPLPAPPTEVVPLDRLVRESRGENGGQSAIDAHAAYQVLREYYLALQSAKAREDAAARSHLTEARRVAIEAGSATLETLMSGLLMRGIKADVLPAVIREESEILHALTTTTNHTPGMITTIGKLLLPEAEARGGGEASDHDGENATNAAGGH